MKTIFNIFIIIFVAVSAYTMRDDLTAAYQKARGFISQAIKTPVQETTPQSDTQNQINTEAPDKVLGLKKLIDTPGALRVSGSVLGNSSDEQKLSRKGVIDWTNQNRKMQGNLPPLVENTKLDFSAEKKLQDMFQHQYFEHISPSKVGVSDLGDEAGYEYIIIGENLALGDFKNDQALVQAWMNSPGHRANILNTRYTDIGIAVGKGIFEGKEVWLAVQHFGLPKSACPLIDSVLKGNVTVNQKLLKDMDADLKKRRANIDSEAVVDGKTRDEQIKEYNEVVNKYNTLVSQVKKQIETYNKQVRAFNQCVESGD